MTARERGRQAEEAAAGLLARHGLRLVERNYQCRLGEIDLVMNDGATLVFVEVRSRNRGDYGCAAASIDAHKRRRIVNAARYYLQSKHYSNTPARFDVVAIDGGDPEWIRNAFDAGDCA